MPLVLACVPPVLGRRREASDNSNRGAIYARYSTRHQHSIEDQVRACREWAERNGISVSDDMIFSDAGVSGKTHKRPGWQRFNEALVANNFDVAIVYATNRLFRKQYRAVQFVAEEILDQRKRCVFVSQNIDTAESDHWQTLVQVLGLTDELQIKHLKSQVHAGQQGLLLKGMLHGTVTFGYAGEIIEGSGTKSGKPRRRWRIDPTAAEWVRRAFAWFTEDQLGYSEVARRFRKDGAPPPARARRWNSRAIQNLLSNRRYVGDWSYGWRESVWQNKAGYNRQIRREQPIMPHNVPELRLVDDAVFLAAQAKVASYKPRGGRPSRRTGAAADHLLRDLLWCPVHNRPLSTWGTGAQWLACHQCKRSEHPELFSMVNRRLAEKLLCQELRQLILQDQDLCSHALAAAQEQIRKQQMPDPALTEKLKRDYEAIEMKIRWVLENPGETATDRQENREVIRKLRAERAILETRISEIERAQAKPPRVPSETELQAVLNEIEVVLTRASAGEDPDAVAAARATVRGLTSGRIVMQQCGEARQHGGWLSGTFQPVLLGTVLHCCGNSSADVTTSAPVTIEFRKPPVDQQLMDRAKALYDRQMLVKDIAGELGISKLQAQRAIGRWFEIRSLPIPDARKRRGEIERTAGKPKRHELLMPQIMELYHQGMAMQEIATRVGTHRDLVTEAVKLWHRSHGLAVPDGRTRRKALAAGAVAAGD